MALAALAGSVHEAAGDVDVATFGTAPLAGECVRTGWAVVVRSPSDQQSLPTTTPRCHVAAGLLGVMGEPASVVAAAGGAFQKALTLSPHAMEQLDAIMPTLFLGRPDFHKEAYVLLNLQPSMLYGAEPVPALAGLLAGYIKHNQLQLTVPSGQGGVVVAEDGVGYRAALNLQIWRQELEPLGFPVTGLVARELVPQLSSLRFVQPDRMHALRAMDPNLHKFSTQVLAASAAMGKDIRYHEGGYGEAIDLAGGRPSLFVGVNSYFQTAAARSAAAGIHDAAPKGSFAVFACSSALQGQPSTLASRIQAAQSAAVDALVATREWEVVLAVNGEKLAGCSKGYWTVRILRRI